MRIWAGLSVTRMVTASRLSSCRNYRSIHLTDAGLALGNFKRSSLLRRIPARVSRSAKKVSSADTGDIVLEFKDPHGNMRVEFVLLAAIIVAWLTIACTICLSLNWF